MKRFRTLALGAAIVTLVAAAGLQTGMSQLQNAYAEGGTDLGVFGFAESDWGDAGNPVDAYTVFDEESVDFWVRFDGDKTTLVEAVFSEPFRFDDMEAYVRNELLPGDAGLSVDYEEILVADGDPRLRVQLYDSRELANFSPDSLGYIVVTYVLDGAGLETSRVSLTIGSPGF